MTRSTLFDRLNTELEAFGRKAQSALDEGKVQIELLRVRRRQDNAARDLGILIHRRERGGDAERLRDLYLEPFTGNSTPAELREAFTHAYLLAAVVRAIGWHELLADQSRRAVRELGDPVAGWLEVFDGIRDRTITLGQA